MAKFPWRDTRVTSAEPAQFCLSCHLLMKIILSRARVKWIHQSWVKHPHRDLQHEVARSDSIIKTNLSLSLQKKHSRDGFAPPVTAYLSWQVFPEIKTLKCAIGQNYPKGGAAQMFAFKTFENNQNNSKPDPNTWNAPQISYILAEQLSVSPIPWFLRFSLFSTSLNQLNHLIKSGGVWGSDLYFAGFEVFQVF